MQPREPYAKSGKVTGKRDKGLAWVAGVKTVGSRGNRENERNDASNQTSTW